MVKQHRGIAADLRLNFWEVDKRMKNSLGHFDFLGDFSSTKQNWGVDGTLWVEMKVLVKSLDFAEKLEVRRQALESKLNRVKQAHPEIEGVILLATKAQKDGRTWQKPETLVQLFKVGADTGDWKTLAGKAPKKPTRGRAKRKPPLQHLWDTLPSETIEGKKCYYVANFLEELGLTKNSIKKRADQFDSMIANHGCPDALFQEKIPGKAGQPIWFGSRRALRALYDAL
jgi:hypothetical protein